MRRRTTTTTTTRESDLDVDDGVGYDEEDDDAGRSVDAVRERMVWHALRSHGDGLRLLRPIRHRDDVMDIGGGGGEGGGVGGGETGEEEEEKAAATATGKGGKGGGTCGASDAGGSWPVVEAIERPLEHALTDVATSCPLLLCSRAKPSADRPRTGSTGSGRGERLTCNDSRSMKN